jgi:hypothetical protein
LEFGLIVILGSFPNIKCSIQLSNHIRFFPSKLNFLVETTLTKVLPYSYLPLIRRLASIAELMSLKMMKAWPLILILRLAIIFMKWHLHRLSPRTPRRCWTKRPLSTPSEPSHSSYLYKWCCWQPSILSPSPLKITPSWVDVAEQEDS